MKNKRGSFIFLFGLLMFMLGIFLFTHLSVIGILIGISGGIIMGSSTSFLITNKTKF
ncbi:hypothetical protein RAH41_09055 [Gottfriedia acidiceleris]|uniref:hypothetical protein n=1 Tax=Gottfriedia acidiceleris TaxID=371036 RepID=UPI002F2685D8